MIMSGSLQTPAEIKVQKLKEHNSLPSCVTVHLHMQFNAVQSATFLTEIQTSKYSLTFLVIYRLLDTKTHLLITHTVLQDIMFPLFTVLTSRSNLH
jgi:hypothetical protein